MLLKKTRQTCCLVSRIWNSCWYKSLVIVGSQMTQSAFWRMIHYLAIIILSSPLFQNLEAALQATQPRAPVPDISGGHRRVTTQYWPRGAKGQMDRPIRTNLNGPRRQLYIHFHYNEIKAFLEPFSHQRCSYSDLKYQGYRKEPWVGGDLLRK